VWRVACDVLIRILPTSHRHRCTGILVYWYTGILVYWYRYNYWFIGLSIGIGIGIGV
jgi:hypothetical protein